jgi:hypothetical protein
MSIRTADTIVALCIKLTDADIAALPPAERRRLADHCRHVADRADGSARKAPNGKAGQPSGVLFEIGSGAPRHE